MLEENWRDVLGVGTGISSQNIPEWTSKKHSSFCFFVFQGNVCHGKIGDGQMNEFP